MDASSAVKEIADIFVCNALRWALFTFSEMEPKVDFCASRKECTALISVLSATAITATACVTIGRTKFVCCKDKINHGWTLFKHAAKPKHDKVTKTFQAFHVKRSK